MGDEQRPHQPEEPMNSNHYEMIARELAGRPEAKAYAWQVLDFERDGIDAMRISLADVPLYVKGDKAGQPNYRRCTNKQDIYVTPDQAEAWKARHPDVCLECANEREVFVRWSADEGTTMKPCPVCNADGAMTPEPEQVEAEGSLFAAGDSHG